MSVQFYPFVPLENLESQFVEDGKPLYGEIEVYKKLYEELSKSDWEWHVWHHLHLPYQSSSGQRNKTEGEIDFLILCREGLLVLEVKGGRITFKEHRFYYGDPENKVRCQDPFEQARGYKQVIINHVLQYPKMFICEAVALPHVNYDLFPENYSFVDLHKLWTQKTGKERFSQSFEEFLKSVFEYARAKYNKAGFHYPFYSSNDLHKFVKYLNPETAKFSDFLSTLKWLQIDNLEILEGMIRNPRIMLEGPPGSGKTTIAKAYIDSKSNKRGLFLCWNRFLSVRMRNLLSKRDSSNQIEVLTLVQFVTKYCSDIPLNDIFNSTPVSFSKILTQVVHNLRNDLSFERYDYIVIDEGQDLFCRGVDVLLDELCCSSVSGLNDGNILLLYDLNQVYFREISESAEVSDYLVNFFSHFKLSEVKRSLQSPNIRKLAEKIQRDEELSIIPSDDVKIRRVKNLTSAKSIVLKEYIKPMRDKSTPLKGVDCILLVDPSILNSSHRFPESFYEVFDVADVVELNDDNLDSPFNVLRYTSPFKFKGLESKHVIYITFPLSNYNAHDIFVGVTRAICTLDVIVIEGTDV